jgi:hypothetical protein
MVNGVMRYQIAYRVNIGGTEFVSICHTQNNYPVSLSKNYQEGSTIEDTQTWSTTFFHEIMHVLPLGRKSCFLHSFLRSALTSSFQRLVTMLAAPLLEAKDMVGRTPSAFAPHTATTTQTHTNCSPWDWQWRSICGILDRLSASTTNTCGSETTLLT